MTFVQTMFMLTLGLVLVSGDPIVDQATRCNNRLFEVPCVCGEIEVASLCQGQQTICEHSTGTCHDKLPEPIFLIVGQSGSGKSSLARALSGVDPKCRDCQDVFPVCKRSNLDSCTGSTSYRTSPWLGLPNNPIVTIVDTPGFGDVQGRGEEQQTEMMEILNEEVGSANAIILLIKATDTRFLPGLQIMLKKMEVLFGEKMWDHVIISLSFWTYSKDDIECREYDDCPTEEEIKNEINKQLRQHLGLTVDLKTVFIDILAKRDRDNIKNDIFRQSKLEEEAQKLYDFAKKHDAFEFKTINDIFQENIRMKRQISVLEETLDDNITVLFEEVAHNKAANERCILDISEGLKGIKSDMGPKIEENTKGIQSLKGDISTGLQGLKGDISKGIQGVKGDISEGLKGIKSDMGPKIEENTKGIQGLKGDISKGIQGLKGDISKGIQGLKGDISKGIQGVKGDISEGLMGIKSDMGPKIEENIKGIQGLKGDIFKGIQGLKGDISKGIHDLKGDISTGIQGLKGDISKGIQGVKGDISKGLLGIKSDMGPKIDENANGIQGLKGDIFKDIQGLKGDISTGIQGLKGDISDGLKSIKSDMGPKIEENTKGIQGLKGDISKGIQGLKGDISKGIHGLKGDISTGIQGLKGDISKGIQGVKGDISKGLMGIKSDMGPKVFFAVTHTGSGGNGGTITFGETVANEGQGMDPSTGVFTAPVDGVYDFKLSGLTNTKTYIDVYLNDVSKVRMYDKYALSSVSRAWQFKLKRGDRVYLSKITGRLYYTDLHGEKNCLYFIGILM